MRIAFVNNQLQLGGAETVVWQLHRGCRRFGHSSRLYVAHGKTYPLGQGVVPLYPRLLSRFYHSRFQPVIERFSPRRNWTDRAFRKLGQGRADLIHLHNFHGDYATLESLAALACSKAVVWTFHAFWGITGGCDHPRHCRKYLENCGECPWVNEWPLNGKDDTAEQLLLKKKLLAGLPLTIVSPSRHLAAAVQQSPVGGMWRVEHIPNGVDPNRFGFARKHDPEFRRQLGFSPPKTIVLVVNRNFSDPLKGFPMVEKALGILESKDIQVAFVGANSTEAVCRLSVHLPCVDFGYVADRTRLAELYEAADIFLFASPAENFPCVILEAMAARCCVVATPTSGVVEQVRNGETGFLSAEISGESLAETLKAALAAPEVRTACAARAREQVEKYYSEELMVERHLKLYSSVLARA